MLRSLEWPYGAVCDAGPVVAALALPGYMPEQLAGCQSSVVNGEHMEAQTTPPMQSRVDQRDSVLGTSGTLSPVAAR